MSDLERSNSSFNASGEMVYEKVNFNKKKRKEITLMITQQISTLIDDIRMGQRL
jgi:hypothetical protein